MRNWTYWCLEGCGKKVIHIGCGIYECKLCHKRFDREQLNELN